MKREDARNSRDIGGRQSDTTILETAVDRFVQVL